MPSFTNLLVVMAISFGAPLLLGLFPRVQLPSVVLELIDAAGSAALIGAGLLSVVLFPLGGLLLLRRAPAPGAGSEGNDGTAPLMAM